MNQDDYTPIEWLRFYNNGLRDGVDPAEMQARLTRVHPQSMTLEQIRMAVQTEGPSISPAMQRLANDDGSGLGDFVRMAAQGGTFGFADELAGMGAQVIPGGRDYHEALAASRQRVSDLRETSPGASAMAEAAGGMLLPAGAASRIAGRIAPAGSSLVGKIMSGMVGGALSGGGAGAAYGFGDTNGTLLERLAAAKKHGAVGAGVGYVAGGLFPALGGGLGATGRSMAETLVPTQSAGPLANRRLGMKAAEAQIDPAAATTQMGELGPGAIVADLDPVLAREAKTSRNMAASLDRAGGPVEMLEYRAAQRGERMAAQMREVSGISEDMPHGEAASRAAIQKVREDYYIPLEDAFPVVDGPNVREALKIPGVSRTRASIRSSDPRRARPPVAPGAIQESPSFTELQAILKSLDDDVTAAVTAGRPNASMAAREVRDTLRDAMELDVPGFAEAQREYMLASKKLESYAEGFRLWKSPSRTILETMNALPSDEAKDAFRVGMLQHWEESLLNREGSPAIVTDILRGGPEMREKIGLIFGGASSDSYREFTRRMGVENVFQNTERAIGTRTTYSTAQQSGDVLSAGGPPTRAKLLNRVLEAIFSPEDAQVAQAEMVGETLFGPGLERLLSTMQRNSMTSARVGPQPMFSAAPSGALGSIAAANWER